MRIPSKLVSWGFNYSFLTFFFEGFCFAWSITRKTFGGGSCLLFFNLLLIEIHVFVGWLVGHG